MPHAAASASIDAAAPADDTLALPPAEAAPPGTDRVAVVGAVAFLMMSSPLHRHVFLTDLEWLVVPPVSLGQCRLWRRGEVPVAFASWAFLGADQDARLREGARRLAPGEWQSGDQAWLIDLIVPFGGRDAVVQELRRTVFAGRRVKTLQAAPGGGVAVVEW